MNRHQRRSQRKERLIGGKRLSGISPKVPLKQQLTDATELYASGKLEEAAECCLDAIAGAPLDAEAFHLLALVRYRQGRLQDAGENILEAITRNDDDPEIHANCGAIMNMLGRHAEAEAACRHVIDLKPNNAEAYNNLSVALEMQKRIDEAQSACRQALRLKPDYPEALINYGNLSVRRGDFVTGVEYYTAAIERAPGNPTARANLSVALLRLGESEAALSQAEEALALAPDYVEALNALGNAHSARADYPLAEEAFRKAVSLQPAHREAGVNLAATLHKLGRSDDAIAAYQEVLQSNPSHAGAENGIGVVLLAKGKTSAATAAFRRAIDIDQTLTNAYYNLVCSGARPEPDEIDLMNSLVGRPSTTDLQKIDLHFSLAEVADGQGDRDGRMRHLKLGNNLRKRQFDANEISFDGEQLDQHIADIMEVFSPSVLSMQQFDGNASELPVFVCGMPRSGTTLVEQILASHPDVGTVGELGVAGTLLADFPHDVHELDAGRISELCDHVLHQLETRVPDKPLVIDKSPFSFFHLGLIQRLFPQARVIHCRRDAMDVALSCFAQNFVANHPWSTSLDDIARFILAEQRISSYWADTLALRRLDVQYEELIADPEGQSRRMIEFLGLTWNDSCLRFYENEQTVLTASNWQVRKPMYHTSVGKAEGYGALLKDLQTALDRRA